MRGELLLNALELLERSVLEFASFSEVFGGYYGATARRRLRYLDRRRERLNFADGDALRDDKRRADNLLYILRRDKLVSEQRGFVRLTSAGKKVLETLKLRRSRSLPGRD